MVEFKAFEREQRELENSGIRQELVGFMDKFETGLGSILKHAWMHVEVSESEVVVVQLFNLQRPRD